MNNRLSVCDYDSKAFNALTPCEYIREIFKNTDKDGIVRLPDLPNDYDSSDAVLCCKMNFDGVDRESVISDFSVFLQMLTDTIYAYVHNGFSGKNPVKAINKEMADFFKKYISEINLDEFNEIADEGISISSADRHICRLKRCFADINERANARIGGNFAFMLYRVCRNIFRIVEISGCKSIIDRLNKMLAQSYIINRFAVSVEYIYRGNPYIEKYDIDVSFAYSEYRNISFPDFIKQRISKEWEKIAGQGSEELFGVLKEFINKCNESDIVYSFKSGISSSFIAYISGITGINPLPAHYHCEFCGNTEFIGGKAVGFDMPAKTCPVCGEDMTGDGFNLSDECFFGVDGEKAPDIRINISLRYCKEKVLGIIKAMTENGLPEHIKFVLSDFDNRKIGREEDFVIEICDSEINEYLQKLKDTVFSEPDGAYLRKLARGEFGKLLGIPDLCLDENNGGCFESGTDGGSIKNRLYPEYRDDVLQSLINLGISEQEAFRISDNLNNGLVAEDVMLLREHNVSELFIEKLKSEKNLLPKSIAVGNIFQTLKLYAYKKKYPHEFERLVDADKFLRIFEDKKQIGPQKQI